MSWEQLLSIYEENESEMERVDTEPPTSCPNDGEPLQAGPNGELHCPFDGFIWVP